MTIAIIIVIVSLIVWVLLSTPFQLWRERKKTAKMAALDRTDGGQRLAKYYNEVSTAEDEIAARWQGQYPTGTDGKLLRYLATVALLCIRENPKACLKKK